MKKIIFIPRTEAFIKENEKVETRFPQLDKMQARWGEEYQVEKLPFNGKFQLETGGQLYVMAGHGKPGSAIVSWGDEKNQKNWLSAKQVAGLTAERFPDCRDVSSKIYSCHSGEGGFNSFATQFALFFKPAGEIYNVTIFGYSGAISPAPQEITKPLYDAAKGVEEVRLNMKTRPNLYKDVYLPADYTGPKESVKISKDKHRWSKILPGMIQGRAKEFRVEVSSFGRILGPHIKNI
jgi:hypothetical protein